MNIKKKLAVGALSAALGLSLVGGGTWAAFNDIETVTASAQAGTINLTLAQVANNPYNFHVSNLKPGDSMTRTVQLKNDGTLAIKDVLLSIDNVNFGAHTDIDYLKQFNVTAALVGAQGGASYPHDIILQDITLADLYQATTNSSTVSAANKTAAINNIASKIRTGYWDSTENRLGVTPIAADYNPADLAKQYAGIPVGVAHNLQITIQFNDDPTKDPATGLYTQNQFQGDSADVTFTLEARQWQGQTITDSDLDSNGKVTTNEKPNNGENFQ